MAANNIVIAQAGDEIHHHAPQLRVYLGQYRPKGAVVDGGQYLPFVDNDPNKPNTDITWTEIGPYVQCQEIWQTIGPTPAKATILLPATPIIGAVPHEKAGVTAFGAGWDIRDIKIGDRIIIQSYETFVPPVSPTSPPTTNPVAKTLWLGSVVFPERRKDGSIVLECLDDRWLCESVVMVGRWIGEPTYDIDGNILYVANAFQQGWAPVFNPTGLANRMLSDTGQPVFSPSPEFGIPEDDGPATTSSDLEIMAGYWEASPIVDYLMYSCGPTDGPNQITALNGYDTDYMQSNDWKIELPRLPYCIKWPKNLGGALDAKGQIYFQGSITTTVGEARKGREIDATDRPVLDVLQAVCDAAGGYSIGVDYSAVQSGVGGWITNTTLKIVSSRYRDGTGSLNIATGPLARSAPPIVGAFNYPSITDGYIGQNGRNVLTQLGVSGELAFVEQRCSELPTSGPAQLVPRWKKSDMDALIAAGAAAPYGTPAAVRQYLWTQFPYVGTTYSLNPEWDFRITGATDDAWLNMDLANIPRPVGRSILTWIGGNGMRDYQQARYPIRIEAKVGGTWVGGTVSDYGTYVGGTWLPVAREFDGLEIWNDGTIFLPALRDFALDSTTSVGNFSWNGARCDWSANITINPIRMTLAIPYDHRVSVVCSIYPITPSNKDMTGMEAQLGNQNLDILSPGFSRKSWRTPGLYHHWQRHNAWSIPEKAGPGIAQLPERVGQGVTVGGAVAGNPLRSDLDLQLMHARRQLWEDGKIISQGQVIEKGWYDTGVYPGYEVMALKQLGVNGAKDVKVESVVQSMCFRPIATEIFLGVRENQVVI